MRKVAKNIKETNKTAQMFVDKILQGKNKHSKAIVIGLSGNLGVGKTAFIKAAGKYLGIKHKINSPTFVIIKKYPAPKQAWCGAGPFKNMKYKFLFHVDAYRLKNEKELLNLGWEKIIDNKNNLVFIEWPENVSKIIPSHAKFVYITIGKNNHRNLRLK